MLEDDHDSDEEMHQSNVVTDILGVGAGTGGALKYISELNPLNYIQAMASKDRIEWENVIKKECDRMMKYKVWKSVPKEDFPDEVESITTTWEFKKQSTGSRRGRSNAHGFKQKARVYFKKDSFSSPVTNEVSIRAVLVFMIVLQLLSGALDVKGVF